METFCLISPAHLRPCWPLCCWSVVSFSSASETFYFLFWSINLQHLVMVCRPILLRSIHLFNDKKCSGLLKTFRWGHFFYRYALVTNGLFHPQPRPAGLAAHQAAAHHRHRGIFGPLQWVDTQYCWYKIWNMLIFTPASHRAGLGSENWDEFGCLFCLFWTAFIVWCQAWHNAANSLHFQFWPSSQICFSGEFLASSQTLNGFLIHNAWLKTALLQSAKLNLNRHFVHFYNVNENIHLIRHFCSQFANKACATCPESSENFMKVTEVMFCPQLPEMERRALSSYIINFCLGQKKIFFEENSIRQLIRI